MIFKQQTTTKPSRNVAGATGAITVCSFIVVEMACLRSWVFELFNWTAQNTGAKLFSTPPTTIGLILVTFWEGWPVLLPISIFGWMGYDIIGLGFATAIGYAVTVFGGPIAGLIVVAIAAWLINTSGVPE
jgi:hypothetical protein